MKNQQISPDIILNGMWRMCLTIIAHHQLPYPLMNGLDIYYIPTYSCGGIETKVNSKQSKLATWYLKGNQSPRRLSISCYLIKDNSQEDNLDGKYTQAVVDIIINYIN